MARHHRVFIAFAIEDEWARTYLVGQMRDERSPFHWTDMSVKNPWSTDWRNQCRTRIRGCDGLIALVSRRTGNASGQLFEVRTAKEEGLPVMGIYTKRDDRPWLLPAELQDVPIRDWTWNNINGFLRWL